MQATVKNNMRTLILPLFLALFACQSQPTRAQKLAVEAFELQLNTPALQLIDVRTPEEFATGHLKGAVNINFRDADFRTKMAKLDKTKPIAIYCGIGGRSSKTVEILSEMGFANVLELDGGVKAWQEKGRKLE